MISILTTNIFPEQNHLDMVARCLSAQTCQDFEWVLLDGHYRKNKEYIENICNKYLIKNYIHAPLCKANHVGRLFHWEVYNNALMLSNYDLFLRLGTYRWLHHDMVAKAIEYAQKGEYLDFPHINKEIEKYNDLDNENINKDLSPIYNETRDYMECSAGMFSYSKSRMIGMNGNNEAAVLLVHPEDSDLNARWTHIKGVHSIKVQNALFRFNHEKHQKNLLAILEEGDSSCCRSNGCLATYPNLHHLNYNPPTDNNKFIYRDFQWIKCSCCGAISPIDIDEYLSYLKTYTNPFGPVGVDGRIGRNLLILDNDIRKLNNIDDKVNLLIDSHTNNKYLQEKTLNFRNNNHYNDKIQFKEIIKEYCTNNNINFVDRDLLSNKHLKDRQLDDTVEFDILKYLLPYFDDSKDIFLFEILQDINQLEKLNDVFSICKSDRIFISMKHLNYPNIEKVYNTIEWWDLYIKENNDIYSDAKETNKIRDNIDEKYQKYLNCLFCIKRKVK